MAVYRATCEAARLADGVEIIAEEDFLALQADDEVDVRMPGEGPHYSFRMSGPGDVVEGVTVQVWTWADLSVTLTRVGPRRFRVGMTEERADALHSLRVGQSPRAG